MTSKNFLRQVFLELLIVWKYLKQNWVAPLITAMFTISLWLFAVTLIEIVLYHNWWVVRHLSRDVSFALLLLISFAAMFYFKKKRLRKKLEKLPVFIFTVILSVTTLIGVNYYQQTKEQLNQTPQIKSLSKDWSIQGDRIKITGRNFGQAWQEGTVKVDDLYFNIKSWSDTHIIVEQPITDQYKKSKLVVTNHYNKQTQYDFTLKNPSEVL